jgi:hypothetical protein
MELRYKQTGNPIYSMRHYLSEADTSVITICYNDEVITIPKDSSFNALTHEEKWHIAEQYYIQKKNPIDVVTLDSLFRVELAQRALPVQTAVICITKDSVYRSRPDTAFYASAIATDEIPVKLTETTLRAYVCVPFGYWLNENRYVYFSVLLLWVLIAGLFTGYVKRKKNAIIPMETVEEEPLPEIASEIHFDEKRGMLSCEQTVVELTEIQLELFCSLLNAPKHFLSYAEMKKDIWHNEAIHSNTIQKCIRRLNEGLSPLPLTIIIVHRKGCNLEGVENLNRKPDCSVPAMMISGASLLR